MKEWNSFAKHFIAYAFNILFLAGCADDAVSFYVVGGLNASRTPAQNSEVQMQSHENENEENDNPLGGPDNGNEGLVGKVFQIPNNVNRIPSFENMIPVTTVVAQNLNVPNTRYEEGFPGVPGLLEWFGIRYEGRLEAPVDGVYIFGLISDDGANLYIDGVKVVDNDGIHAIRAVRGSFFLTAGIHTILVDYVQGPRWYVALQLLWKIPGASTYEIIPADYLSRPQGG